MISGSKSAASATQKWADQTGNAFAKVEASSKSLERTQSALGALGGKLMGLVSFTAITAGIGKCIKAASDLTEVQNVVDKAFGNLSYRADEFAKTAISSFGLTELQAKQFSANFMAMGKSMGIAEGQAADLAIQLAGMTGDVASFFNLDQETAYTKLKSIFTGETQSLKELGVVMTETNLKEFALAQGITTSYSAMSQAEKVMLRYNYVMHTLAYAQGDFADTSTQWANNVRVLKNQFVSLISVLGKGFIAVLNPVVTVLNTILGHLVGFANAVSDVFSSVFGTANTKLSAGLGSVNASGLAIDLSDIDSAASDAADSVGRVGKATKGATSAAKELQRQILGFDRITKLTAQTSSGGGRSGSSGGGSGGTSGGGSGSSGLGVTASTAAAAGSVLDSITEKTDAFSGAMGRFRDYLAGLDFSPMKDAWDKLAEAGGKLGGVFKGGLQWGLEHVLEPLGKWTIEKAAPAAMNALASGMHLFTVATLALEPALGWAWDNLVGPLLKLAGNAVVNGLNAAAGLFDGLSNLIEGNEKNGPLLDFTDTISMFANTLFYGKDKAEELQGRKEEHRQEHRQERVENGDIPHDILVDWFASGGAKKWWDGVNSAVDTWRNKHLGGFNLGDWLDSFEPYHWNTSRTGASNRAVPGSSTTKPMLISAHGLLSTDERDSLGLLKRATIEIRDRMAGKLGADGGIKSQSAAKATRLNARLTAQSKDDVERVYGLDGATMNTTVQDRLNEEPVSIFNRIRKTLDGVGISINDTLSEEPTPMQTRIKAILDGTSVKLNNTLQNTPASLATGFQNSWRPGTLSHPNVLKTTPATLAKDFISKWRPGNLLFPTATSTTPASFASSAVKKINDELSKSGGKVGIPVTPSATKKLSASDLIDKKTTVELKYTTGTSKAAKVTTNIGKLKFAARGGIVDRAMLFGTNLVAGEAGREAIIPLESHTEWLDMVASRIVQMLAPGATAGGQQIHITLTMPNGKVLGETVVDYLHGEANQGRYPLHNAGAV